LVLGKKEKAKIKGGFQQEASLNLFLGNSVIICSYDALILLISDIYVFLFFFFFFLRHCS